MMYGQAGQQGQDPGMYYGGQGQGSMGGYGQQYNMGGPRDSSLPRVPSACAAILGGLSPCPRCAGDFENVWVRIHSIKGCAACLGAKAVVHLCDSMRGISRDRNPASAERWAIALAQLRELLEETQTKMDEYCAPVAPSGVTDSAPGS